MHDIRGAVSFLRGLFSMAYMKEDITDPIVEVAIRKELNKPEGELTKVECEKGRGWISPSIN